MILSAIEVRAVAALNDGMLGRAEGLDIRRG